MRKVLKYKKLIAAFFLVAMSSELLIPVSAFALTSGPAQPEAQKFEPAGTSNMVDLFSGDMSYNIPLMDVGGYPVNIAYQSGSGMDDEATWVGAGWTLNPGAVNRQLRGLPDDFNGDIVTKEFHKKPFIKVGADVRFRPTLFGFLKNVNIGAKVGVFKDNYYGIGADVGVNASISMSKSISGSLTAGLGLGADLTTSSRDGVSVSPNLNLSVTAKVDGVNDLSLGGSVAYGYNTRAGLKNVTLGTSFSINSQAQNDYRNALSVSGSATYSIGETHIPTITTPMNTNGFTFDFDLGPIVFGPYLGFGGSGYYTITEVANTVVQKPAYGYLNSEKGKDDLNTLMDFNREKDIPYFKGVPAIPIPVVTNDFFSVANQEGVMQFRPFRSGTGIVFDNLAENKTVNQTLGATVGAISLFQGGGSYYRADANTRTQKWVAGNSYRNVGDFQQFNPAALQSEPAYFKRTGEKLKADAAYYTSLLDESARAVQVSNPGIALASNKLIDKNRNAQTISSPITKQDRERRVTNLTYLTAFEASLQGLDKRIKSVTGFGSNSQCGVSYSYRNFQRFGFYRKPHHISEITVTKPEGQRYVYGVPVYNIYQEDVTFSTVDAKKTNTPAQFKTLRDNGLIAYAHGIDNSDKNKKGRDHYYNKEITPAYATSFLLSGILSPDYMDKTGDGITEDDLGTAVKFNYQKLNNLYQWRSPYGLVSANYNEGILVDGKDDKASYVYGQKETWYMHSIESKTMVAVFEVSDREDGLGVLGPSGGKNMLHKLKKLDSIRLYSKADLQKAGGNLNNAIPVKVVHFEYDYSTCPNVLNNSGAGVKKDGTPVTQGDPLDINVAKGKLTLKKIYFTFGKNRRGITYPYEFSYNPDAVGYEHRQIDRWGTYKNRNTNPQYNDAQLGMVPLNNSEFPYTIQDATLTDANVSKWQLSQITLPSGGKIKVTYESDDYGYVQNRRAMQMCTVNGIQTSGNNTNLIYNDQVLVNLPYPCATDEEFRFRYLEGIEYLYYKFYIQLNDNANNYDYVPGYVKIKKDQCTRLNNNVGIIKIDNEGGFNPISKNTWQFLRLSLPQIAYPGYDNSEMGGNDFKKLILALKDAIGNLSELVTPFDEKAERRKYANTIKLDRSWVRLCSPALTKKGGGSRVKKIEITDEWSVMTNNANAPTGTGGQLFTYTTTAQNQAGEPVTISSGIAAYEPMIGNDENPFRQPITYREKVKMGLDNYYYIEEPVCESYYPAAIVGYSTVTVTNFGKETPESNTFQANTGYTVSEYFTAKDFPTLVEQVPNDPKFFTPSFILKALSGNITDRVAISQGYKVEINDMHGKPKKEQIYNKGGSLVSMTEYFYKTENPDAEFKRLDNTVSAIGPDAVIDHTATLGKDIELFTDMRQQQTINIGKSIGGYGGGIPTFFPLFPVFPFFKINASVNQQVTSFNSASTIKVVQKYGILVKVRKTNDGSTLTSENLLWDAETGEVLLTKTQNEFEDPVYSFTYPAHWAYKGMGAAYKNAGLVIPSFSTDPVITGKIPNSYKNILFPGDELATLLSFSRLWVSAHSDGSLRLIDVSGNLVSMNGRPVKVYRSGKRNIPAAGIGTVVMLQNPIEGNQLVINTSKQILDASTTIFKDEWAVPLNSTWGTQPGDYACPDCAKEFLYAAVTYRYPNGRRGIFSLERDNNSIGSLLSQVYTTEIENENSFFFTDCYDSYLYDQPSTAFGYYLENLHRSLNIGTGRYNYALQNGDVGQLGNGTITYNCVAPEFNALVNNNSTETAMRQDLEENYCFRLAPGYQVGSTCTYDLIKKGPENIDNCPPPEGEQQSQSQSLVVSPLSVPLCIGKVVLRFTIDIPPPKKEICGDPINQIINPYFTGILGNWRSYQQQVYTVDRVSLISTSSIPGSTDIRKSGYYNAFSAFWQYDPVDQQYERSASSVADEKWIKNTEMTGFNRKAMEIENKNALDSFSAATFSYLESLPTAVATNAKHREIAYDGFEDYNFRSNCGSVVCPPLTHFDLKTQLAAFPGSMNYCNATGCISTAKVHSGKYSLELKGPALSVTRPVSTNQGIPATVTGHDVSGRTILTWNDLAKGFAPTPGRRFIMSFWVYEGHNPTSTTTNLQLKVSGVNAGNNLLQGKKWPVVEDWKRVWVDFTLPVNSTDFTFILDPMGATMYVDDIRVFPFDAQLKSFAYDERSLRLMAEMDENNFATFYEYDDEGMLIRVKKETEKGIMTLKETRSSYRKRQ